MFITLNDEQMLRIWRRRAGLEPALAETSIERFDGLEVNECLLHRMRAWYLDYLANAPVDTVPVSDLTERARVSEGAVAHQWKITAAADVARLTALELDGVGFVPLLDPTADENKELLRKLANRFVRQGSQTVGLYVPRSDTIVVHSAKMPVVKNLRGVEITQDDTYIIDERLA